MFCGICKKPFGKLEKEWLEKFARFLGVKEPPEMKMDKLCPNCGSRFFDKDEK